MLITKNPTSNTTPDPGQGGVAVTGATNTGHGSTTASAVGAVTQTKTCIWTTFPSAGGLVTAITLKVDWTENGSSSDGFTLTTNLFTIEYSLNGGGAWNTLRASADVGSSSSGTSQVSLSTTQDITQVQVRDLLSASGDVGESANITTSVSLIRLEVVTADNTLLTMM